MNPQRICSQRVEGYCTEGFSCGRPLSLYDGDSQLNMCWLCDLQTSISRQKALLSESQRQTADCMQSSPPPPWFPTNLRGFGANQGNSRERGPNTADLCGYSYTATALAQKPIHGPTSISSYPFPMYCGRVPGPIVHSTGPEQANTEELGWELARILTKNGAAFVPGTVRTGPDVAQIFQPLFPCSKQSRPNSRYPESQNSRQLWQTLVCVADFGTRICKQTISVLGTFSDTTQRDLDFLGQNSTPDPLCACAASGPSSGFFHQGFASGFQTVVQVLSGELVSLSPFNLNLTLTSI